MPRCRFRVSLEGRGRHVCRHPGVRTRDALVTPSVCAGCQLSAAACLLMSRVNHARLDRLFEVDKSDRGDRPRVGFVTPNLVLGGAERWVLNMLRYLDAERLALSGVCLLNAAPADLEMCLEASACAPVFGGPVAGPKDGGEPTQHQPEEAADSPPVIRLGSVHQALAALCQRSDVIVAWGSAYFTRLMAHQRFAGEVVVVAHGSAPSTVEMLRTSQQAAHHLVGVSRASAAAFRDPRATVIHNGADAERCAGTVPRNVTRRNWGATEGETLVGFVGRFSWEKNPLAAALAARELNDERMRPHPGPLPEGDGERFRAVYIGSGAHEEAVKATVRQIVPESIFVAPVEQIGNALAALDVFLLASPSEGFSLSLTEAWLCGIPAVDPRRRGART